MARPIKRVRVIDLSASGWRASASSACTIARPMASAGIIAPRAIAKTAATVETSVNQVMSCICDSFSVLFFQLQRLYSAGNIYERQHPEYVGLYQSLDDMQEQNRHGYQESGYEKNQQGCHLQTEYVTEQT